MLKGLFDGSSPIPFKVVVRMSCKATVDGRDIVFCSALTRNMVRDLDVDVVPLNKAPSRLGLKALSKGVRLVVRDSKLYAILFSGALSEAMGVDLKLRKA